MPSSKVSFASIFIASDYSIVLGTLTRVTDVASLLPPKADMVIPESILISLKLALFGEDRTVYTFFATGFVTCIIKSSLPSIISPCSDIYDFSSCCLVFKKIVSRLLICSRIKVLPRNSLVSVGRTFLFKSLIFYVGFPSSPIIVTPVIKKSDDFYNFVDCPFFIIFKLMSLLLLENSKSKISFSPLSSSVSI